MSFLNPNNSEFIAARLTNKGRKAISKGAFDISYFQIGDSEFDYTQPFNVMGIASGTTGQIILSPFDMDNGLKYPYKLDNNTTTTIYGTPVQTSNTQTIRNVMGPAGLITDFKTPEEGGSLIMCHNELLNITSLNGTNTLNVSDGSLYINGSYITVFLGEFGGTDPNNPAIVSRANAIIYKIVSITDNTLTLDRNTPNLSTLSGNIQVVSNYCENEYNLELNPGNDCVAAPANMTGQLNPWSLNIVWSSKPIGFDVNGLDENVTGFTSSKHTSTKQFFGYTTSSGQTFENSENGYCSTFKDCVNTEIGIFPEEQRCVAILHYSEIGTLETDPDRFFKYDDYISTNNDEDSALVEDSDDNPVTDNAYFEVFVPFLTYHRNPINSIGALFLMDDIDYFMTSKINQNHSIKYRLLKDENGNTVGKLFPNHKIIIFDDQEIVAALDYKSNRHYTLPAPKTTFHPNDNDSEESLLETNSTQTIWLTYMFSYSEDAKLNALPCNYYMKFNLTDTNSPCFFGGSSQVSMKFETNSLKNMFINLDGVKNGFIANNFYALLQITEQNEQPRPDNWIQIDLTSNIPNHTIGTIINPSNMYVSPFIITKSMYDNGVLFDLESYMGLIPNEPSNEPQFGDEQPFPGSVSVVRATDIEQLNFIVNLPESQFNVTQNPTYNSQANKRITEIALLNKNKDVMVMAKLVNPIVRNGSQVFGIKLDF